MNRKIYLKLTPLEEAKRIWLERLACSPLKEEQVSLASAHGRTLSRLAVAELSSPAFHGAAMDGVALDAKDSYGASEAHPMVLQIGVNAHWINTGRPLPKNTNAVIMVENVVAGPDGQITIEQAAFPWQHVRKLGEDVVATEMVLTQGSLIGPYELGALAASGVLKPWVYAYPKVAIIPSGSEITPLDELTPQLLNSGEKLPEFNSLTLAALVREAGGEAYVLPIVPDEPAKIKEAVLEAIRGPYDLVVVNAGSSAGSRDFTPEIVAELGELLVHGVNIMPGKPTVLGVVEGKPVMGVPGYPVSAVISFENFGQPLLARWQGRELPERLTVSAKPYQALPSKLGLEEHIRVKLGEVNGELVAVPLPRGAGTVTSLSRADGILKVAANSEGLPAGRPCPTILLKGKKRLNGAVLCIGSHDPALDLLDNFIKAENPAYSLTSAHVGSLGGLLALKAGLCHLAGSHLLEPESGLYNQAAVATHFPGKTMNLVRMAGREQGLIVPAGNPKKIKDLQAVAESGARFINRQRGSGTRVLLDFQLSQSSLKPGDLKGYENEEYTHMNVAAAVLSGLAEVGLGVRSAAQALGLDFIPVGFEQYDLVIPEEYMVDQRIEILLKILSGPDFKAALEAMGGYDVSQTGKIISVGC